MPLVEELFIIVVLGLVVLLRLVGLDLGVRLRARRARGLRAVSFCLPVRAIDGLYCIIHILYYSVVGQRTPRIAYNTVVYYYFLCIMYCLTLIASGVVL